MITGVNILIRSERLSTNILVVDLDGKTKCVDEFKKESFLVEERDLDGLYEIVNYPYDIVFTCSDYKSCPKEELFGAIRQALSIMNYDRKVLLFGEWGIFRDDICCVIPQIHKMTNAYSVNDGYGWYVWHCGRKKK